MTKMQARILSYVRAFIAQKGYSPTCAEIASDLGIYRGTAHSNVVKLAERGYLIKGTGWRNIRLLPDEGRDARAA